MGAKNRLEVHIIGVTQIVEQQEDSCLISLYIFCCWSEGLRDGSSILVWSLTLYEWILRTR